MKRVLTLALGLAALNGCGKDDGGSDEEAIVPFQALPVPVNVPTDVAAAEAAEPTEYEGVYRRHCDDHHLERTLNIKGLRFQLTIAAYDPDGIGCSGDPGVVYIQTEVVKFSGDAEGIDDAKKANFTNMGITARIVTQGAVDKSNKEKSLGFNDWTLNETRNLTGLSEDFPGYNTQLFDLIKLDSIGILYFGDSLTGDGSSEAKRPTALRSSGDAYFKQ